MKSISIAVSSEPKERSRFDEKPKVMFTCGICKKEDHTSERCLHRDSNNSNNTRHLVSRQSTLPNNNRAPVCFKCGLGGHIARFCTAENHNRAAGNGNGPEPSVMIIETLAMPVNPAAYYKNIKVNQAELQALLDTGSTFNLIKDCLLSLTEFVDGKCEARLLRGFGNRTIRCCRLVTFKGSIDGESYSIPALVVPGDVMKVDVILGQA